MSRTLLSVFLVLLSACSALAGEERSIDHVVLVSVDGLSASYFTDLRAEMPNLRAIAQRGAVADGMLTSFPSVTWPSHTSLVTGTHPARHGVIGNSVWNRRDNRSVQYIGDPVLTKQQAIRVPTLYDVAHEAGLSTASVIWPCSNGATTLDYVIPDSNKPELHARYTTPGFAEELAGVGIDISPLGEWGWGKQYSTQRDVLYTQTTLHLLRKHRVNLILVHLITPDGVEHGFGPNTPQAYEAVAESDQRLGEIWAALQQPPFAGRSTMFIVSDHGFAEYRKRIRPNVALKELGLIETDEKNKVTGRKAWCVAQGGSAFIYVLDNEGKPDVTAKLVGELAKLEGVLEVLTPAEFTKLGVPGPDSNPEAPDLVLTTGPGYSFDGSVTSPAVVETDTLLGTHGHDPRPDYMHATFVAAGAGIKSGTKLQVINNVDVAPTIAHLLGLDLDSDGRILTEALAK
jgi:predicted AlkP superfamily pyrophosphatase or phosphodiesterase